MGPDPSEAERVRWIKQPTEAVDFSTPPFARWFPDGKLNLCDNAVDRWAEDDPLASALIAISTETNTERGLPPEKWSYLK